MMPPDYMTHDWLEQAFERACELAHVLRSMTDDEKTVFVTGLIEQSSVAYAIWISRPPVGAFRVEVIKGADLVGTFLTTYVPVANEDMADFLRDTLGDGRPAHDMPAVTQ